MRDLGQMRLVASPSPKNLRGRKTGASSVTLARAKRCLDFEAAVNAAARPSGPVLSNAIMSAGIPGSVDRSTISSASMRRYAFALPL